ncbi:hypothetical protein ACU6U9_01555 [Pseudomonas sp. HK3]
MLRLFTVITLFLLAACNPFNTDDDSTVTLEGTDPNGTSITFVSENGYHAVKLNDQEWVHANNKIKLDSLSESDTLNIIELCEENEFRSYSSGHLGLWLIQYLHLYTNSKNELIKECYSKEGYILPETKTATLVSEQTHDGIVIIDARISDYDYVRFNKEENILTIPVETDDIEHSLIAVGYHKINEQFYVYRSESFDFNDGETITLDFYSENSEITVADTNPFEPSDFNYIRNYCELVKDVCIRTNHDVNKNLYLRIPESLRVESSLYLEVWKPKYYLSNTIQGMSYRFLGKEPSDTNPLEALSTTFQSMKVSYVNQGVEVEIPSIPVFNNKPWYCYVTQQYDGFTIWPALNATTSNNKMTAKLLDISKLPAVPGFFNKTNNEINSANLIMSVSTGDIDTINTHRLEIIVPINIKKITN